MLINALIGLLNYIIEIFASLLNIIFSLLPNSPFHITIPPIVSNLLGYLNYLVPVKEILSILTVWGSCVGIYYMYQIVLRWIKVVE